MRERNPTATRPRPDDRAVSPVIGVILMVAITVVLSATVYVFASGYGIENTNPARSLALESAAPLAGAGGDQTKAYTVAAASSGMKWTDLRLTLDGEALAYAPSATTGESSWRVTHNGLVLTPSPSGTVAAGDLVELHMAGEGNGKTLRVVDSNANSVILTLAVS